MTKQFSKTQLLRLRNSNYRPKLIDMRIFCYHCQYVEFQDHRPNESNGWFVGTLKGIYCN